MILFSIFWGGFCLFAIYAASPTYWHNLAHVVRDRLHKSPTPKEVSDAEDLALETLQSLGRQIGWETSARFMEAHMRHPTDDDLPEMQRIAQEIHRSLIN